MTLTVARHERIEYQRKKYLPATFSRDFVCAECGGRIRLGIDGAYNVLSCYMDEQHAGFIPHSTWKAQWAEETKAMLELEERHKQELLEAMIGLFPTMGHKIMELERQKDANLLHPQEQEI